MTKLVLLFEDPSKRKDNKGIIAQVRAFIGVRCQSEKVAGIKRNVISPDCVTFSEIENEINSLKKNLDKIKREAKLKFENFRKKELDQIKKSEI